MTTFQYLIDAILNALSLLLPFSIAFPNEMTRSFLHWNPSPLALTTLVSMVGSVCLLIFFRYDWLGLFSALIKSTLKLYTLKPSARNLDQHTVLFLLIAFLPRLIFKNCFGVVLSESEYLNHPLSMAIGFFIVSLGLGFAVQRNKKIKGLNHLQLLDSLFISLFCLLSLHPAIPLIFTLWVGFALMNYHYEAIFKYSMLLLALELFTHVISLNPASGGLSAIPTDLGHLNTFATTVVLFTTFWMTLEALQKSFSNEIFNRLKWLNLCGALFYLVLYFMQIT